jgi:flotillin
MDEICTQRETFKTRINQGIEDELKQFGLKIYNANIKELTDAPGSNYFQVLSRKAHETANNEAKVDVAQAQWKGNVGEAERRGNQERDIAKINAETAVSKTERDTERAKAEACYATRKAHFDQEVNIAQIEATRATESKDEELRKEVEIRRAQTELERLRASDVVKATILKESKAQAAEAKAFEGMKAADAHAYETKLNSRAACKYQKRKYWNDY